MNENHKTFIDLSKSIIYVNKVSESAHKKFLGHMRSEVEFGYQNRKVKFRFSIKKCSGRYTENKYETKKNL